MVPIYYHVFENYVAKIHFYQTQLYFARKVDKSWGIIDDKTLKIDM